MVKNFGKVTKLNWIFGSSLIMCILYNAFPAQAQFSIPGLGEVKLPVNININRPTQATPQTPSAPSSCSIIAPFSQSQERQIMTILTAEQQKSLAEFLVKNPNSASQFALGVCLQQTLPNK